MLDVEKRDFDGDRAERAEFIGKFPAGLGGAGDKDAAGLQGKRVRHVPSHF
jgi:hypothetical protein